MTKREIHRGAVLHAVAKRHKFSITKIAKEAAYDQSTFYFHVKQKELPLETLYKYGIVMDHDFSIEIPEMSEYLKANGLIKPSERKKSYEEIELERDYWRDKYYSLLEEQNKLLKGK